MGKRRAAGLAQEPSFLALVDLANEFDTGGVQKGCDAFPEIGLVGAIDFRGNFERHAGRAGDFNGAIDAFLRTRCGQGRRDSCLPAGKLGASRSAGSPWSTVPAKVALGMGAR